MFQKQTDSGGVCVCVCWSRPVPNTLGVSGSRLGRLILRTESNPKLPESTKAPPKYEKTKSDKILAKSIQLISACIDILFTIIPLHVDDIINVNDDNYDYNC